MRGSLLGSWLPPFRSPLFTYSVTFDIVHVESFPLLMEKAVLNGCFAQFTLIKISHFVQEITI